MHPKLTLGANFNDRNFRHLSGNYPQAYENIATPKLIQWKTAKMRGNKPFHGFGGFIFWLFSVVGAVLPSKFAPPFNDSRQSLKGLNGAGAKPCAGIAL